MLEIWYNTNRHRDGRHLAENRTSWYQQIHAHKPLFGNQGRLLDLGHLYFDIVSPVPECRRQGDLELRISDFASLGIFTLVKSPLQISSFMQNKPNFLESQMNVSTVLTEAYENKHNWTLGENKPNTNPNKANTKPIKANKMPKQTQYKPNQTQFPKGQNERKLICYKGI